MTRFYLIILLTCFFGSTTYAQNSTILIYDLIANSVDSIYSYPKDTIIQSGTTAHNLGTFDSQIEVLEQTFPSESVFPNTEFTIKQKAHPDYDLNKFPIRTSVKILYEENDTLGDLCSGSFISKRHVFSAAHCFTDEDNEIPEFPAYYVCPTFNNGTPNPNFGCARVVKLYLLREWSLNGEDFIVLELDQDLGEVTGWLGIGFDDTDNAYVDDVFYKFSYPGVFIPQIDPIPYNGDTIYYNYGKVDVIEENYIGIQSTYGIPGESGSSITKILNEELYTSYGVLTYGGGLAHSRLRNDTYHFVKYIIKNNILASNIDITEAERLIEFYPNPTSGKFEIKSINDNSVATISIYDAMGQNVYSNPDFNIRDAIDLSNQPSGSYVVVIVTDAIATVKSIVKY